MTRLPDCSCPKCAGDSAEASAVREAMDELRSRLSEGLFRLEDSERTARLFEMDKSAESKSFNLGAIWAYRHILDMLKKEAP